MAVTPARLRVLPRATGKPSSTAMLGRDWRIAWPFLLPLLAVLLGLVTYPLLTGLALSLQRKVVGEPATWVGLANYRELLFGEQYAATFWNAVRVTAV